MSRVPIYQVDSFTQTPFLGNPAGVCLLQEELESEVMQRIAQEMNLSETAFAYPKSGNGARRLRWFTPTVEVPLCGHATLASAHILIEHLDERGPIRFETLSGKLVVHEDKERLRMNFPAGKSTPEDPPAGLLSALGCSGSAHCRRSTNAWLVRLGSETDLRGLQPDFADLGRVELGGTAIGVVVTAPGSDSQVDVVSRFFAPWAGIDEDPVTGLGHTILGPYWAEALGRESFTARQISQRPGDVWVQVDGDRVHLTGHAVTVIEGELIL